RARTAFHAAPVLIVAYSGGYHPAAYALERGQIDDRVRGVILLDAPYGDHDKFAAWLARRPPAFFLSAFGTAVRDDNTVLQRLLAQRGVRYRTTLPARLSRGMVAFVAADDEVTHADFVTDALLGDPLKLVLGRV